MMLKRVLLVAVLLTGCSTDQRYKQEINDNEDYLNSAKLEALKLPKKFKLPVENDRYVIYNPGTKGDTGLNVNILPPVLPLATLDGSYASYSRGIAILDMPAAYDVWGKIIALLKSKKMAIKLEKQNKIQISDIVTKTSAKAIPYKASYSISLEKMADRDLIRVELLSLFVNNKNRVNNRMEKQRHTVDLFNMIMLELKKNELNVKNKNVA